MLRALYTGATGMIAQQLHLDVVANNLANVDTNSFKRSHATFQDQLYQSLQAAGTSAQQGVSPTGIQVGLGTHVVSVGKIFSQGDVKNTGNPFDIMIRGEGFFKIQNLAGQEFYTRDGSFRLDETGQLVTADGMKLSDSITIPPEALEVVIAANGEVSVRLPNNSALSSVGQLNLSRFPNPAGLRAVGGNAFAVTEASGAEAVGTPDENGYGSLLQNHLETSNVSVVDEMVNMVTTQRAYEANSKTIRTGDEMLGLALSVKR